METNRARNYQSYRSPVPPRRGGPIGDVMPAAGRPNFMPPQPVHAQPAPPQQPVAVPQPVQRPPQRPPAPRHHAVQHHAQPVHQAAPTHHQPQDSSTISIKLSIPEFRRPTIPPIMKQYPGFWWVLAIGGLLLFTIGYQIGHSHAKPAPVVSITTQQGRQA